ncbi:MAG: GGDEF domain-containing protein [Campylobacterota bacterium]
MMAEIPGLQYYLLVLIVLLLGSIIYNLKQRLVMKKREASETALVKEAYFHPISELPNRRNIDIMVTEQIHRVHRRAQSFLVVVIRIKNYNDINIRSKSEGAEFISEAGTRVVDSVRDEDLVAHISDNTFAILFNEYLEEDNYEILFKRLKNAFKDEFQIAKDKSLMYDIGFGYSQFPDNGTDGDTLINEAVHQALQ